MYTQLHDYLLCTASASAAVNANAAAINMIRESSAQKVLNGLNQYFDRECERL